MDKRMSISLSKELDDAVETFRFKNRDRLPTKNKAINELIALGVEELEARIEAEEEQRNKAPTADEAAEALYVLLYYYLGTPPNAEQVKTLESLIPLLRDGLSSVG